MNKRIVFGVVGGTALLGSVLLWRGGVTNDVDPSLLDPSDPDRIALGERVYAEHCAACHGAELEGEANWREPLPEGGLRAPPHDETGHTWHHADHVLFDYTKLGGQALVGPDFQSNMPGFGDVLSDEEIWSVLSFIKSTWPPRVQASHDERNEAARNR